MNKNEYLSKLSVLLYDLSSEEREAALSYYREYIEDAGAENEAETIKQLGSCEDLAKEIRKGIYQKENIHVTDTLPTPVASSANNRQTKKDTNAVAIILGVVLAIILSPIWIPLGIALFAILFALIITLVAIVIAIGIVGAVCVLCGIVLIFVGFFSIFASPLRGFALLGSSLIIVALGILFLIAIIWGGSKFFPWMMNGVTKLINKMFGQNK